MAFVAIIPDSEADTVELLVDYKTAKRIFALLAKEVKETKALRRAAHQMAGWSGMSVDASARIVAARQRSN